MKNLPSKIKEKSSLCHILKNCMNALIKSSYCWIKNYRADVDGGNSRMGDVHKKDALLLFKCMYANFKSSEKRWFFAVIMEIVYLLLVGIAHIVVCYKYCSTGGWEPSDLKFLSGKKS